MVEEATPNSTMMMRSPTQLCFGGCNLLLATMSVNYLKKFLLPIVNVIDPIETILPTSIFVEHGCLQSLFLLV